MADTSRVIEELIRSSGRRLGAYGYVLTGSVTASEELVHDAIVKVLVRRREITDVKAAEYYVRAAMRTLHIDAMRREATWRRLLPRASRSDEVPDTADDVGGRDEVARLLASLPVHLRTAMALHYYEDLPIADVAAAMRISEGAVKRYLYDGRQRLAPLVSDRKVGDRVNVIER